MVKKRRRHSAAYKLRIALEALEGSKTISQLSSEHEIHLNMIRAIWLHVRGRCHRLAQPLRARLAAFQHPRKHLLRTPMAQRQVRKNLSQPVCHGPSAAGRPERLFRLLQPRETTSKSQLSHAGGRALRALFRAGHICLNAPYFSHFVVQRLGLTIFGSVRPA